jgi:hypothetical protein
MSLSDAACQECERRAFLLLEALRLINPEGLHEIKGIELRVWFGTARRHGGFVFYGHPSWPSRSHIDPVSWFEQ